MHVTTLALRSGGTVTGALSIVLDAAYIETRTAALWRRALLGVAVQTVVIFAITLLSVRLSVMMPMRHMTQWLRDLRAGRASAGVMHTGRFRTIGARGDATGDQPFGGAGRGGGRGAAARHGGIDVDAGAAAGFRARRLGGTAGCSWCPIANLTSTCISATAIVQHGAGERPGDGAGADSAGLRRNLGRAGTGDADRETVDESAAARAARPSAVHAAARVAEQGRGTTASIPGSPTKGSGRCATSRTRARSSAARTGSIIWTVNRKFADGAAGGNGGGDQPGRAGAGLSFRAAAAR